jgi:hypothetical protein
MLLKLAMNVDTRTLSMREVRLREKLNASA